ncbi:hypothetical protein AB6A40_003366 [Gnathostoma spinigerum]|uniref:Death domain-containing protein n=1 Tax=Gnathostoma spinigerum TaxID=75299 RepID=A0ABD6EJC0_9BILA
MKTMEEAVFSMDLERIRSEHKSLKDNGQSPDLIRSTVEDALHRKALNLASDGNLNKDDVKKLLSLTFSVAKEDMCVKSATVSIMQDIFDLSSIAKCEELFAIVEESISLWKTALFYESCKNMILRMGNDLLKRLSRTVNTSFCGRILVLLARSLPLCEKSGLNLVSHFNVDNTTKYEEVGSSVESAATEPQEDMETGEINDSGDVKVAIDHSLYLKFWKLQEYFCDPTLCYDKSKWRTFQNNTDEVLNVFGSYKLEYTASESGEDQRKGKRKHADDLYCDNKLSSYERDESTIAAVRSAMDTSNKPHTDSYYAKYLTNQKLLQLQLNDSQFRRYFLVQCLIIYQYLVSDVKFKDKSYTLNDEQLRFVIESSDKCYRLLRETHPKGSHFAESVKKILQTEKEWSEWKNQGCHDYTTLCDKEKMNIFRRRPRNRYDPKNIDLGNVELTKLWNLNPDMLDACRDSKRKFVPSLKDFLQDPLDELDPEQHVEDEYKSINNEAFQWKASRLLMSESPMYFQMKKTEVTTNMSPFLEEIIKQTALTIPELCSPSLANEEIKSSGRASQSLNAPSEGREEHESSPFVTDSHISELVPLLKDRWTKFANETKLDDRTVEKYEKMEPSHVVRQILTNWRKEEGANATVKRLSSILLSADLFTEQVGNIFKTVS